MNKTGYLIFEIGTECNLGHLHSKCPNTHPDRYKHVDTSRAMSDDTIVDTAAAMIQEHGFRGLIGFHYYNEPTLRLERMFRLMRGITHREQTARFVLWTNGTLIEFDTQYDRFTEIHVTDYEIDAHPCCEARLCVPNRDIVHVHRWPLDDRLTTTGDEPGRPESDAPCCRMFTEMIFDYYGNVHLCCYDWRGLGSPGNIRYNWSLASIVEHWQLMRWTMIGDRMAKGATQVCRTCTAPGRSTHITDFVKAPADAARAYREEVLNREG